MDYTHIIKADAAYTWVFLDINTICMQIMISITFLKSYQVVWCLNLTKLWLNDWKY